MYNKKKKYEGHEGKPHYKKDDHNSSSPNSGQSPSQGSEKSSQQGSQQRSSGSSDSRQGGDNRNPNKKKSGYYSRNKNRNQNKTQNQTQGNDNEKRPSGSRQGSGQGSQKNSGQGSQQGEPKKGRSYWRNRRRKNNQNRNKQNAQGNQNQQNKNQSNKNKNQRKNFKKPPLKYPVDLPDDIQTMYLLDDSILKFKAHSLDDEAADMADTALDSALDSAENPENALEIADTEGTIPDQGNSETLENIETESPAEDSAGSRKLNIVKRPRIKEQGTDSGAICPICDKPILHLNTAIWHRTDDIPAHFDCVVGELATEHKEQLGKNKRIYYVGAGKFAIVKEQFDKRGRLKSYQVVERIEYEHAES